MQSSSTANPPQAHVAHVEDAPIQTHRRAFPVRATAIGSAALLIALLAVLFGYGAAHEGRVFRGVSALGKDLGGMTSADARAALSAAERSDAAGYPSGSLTVAGAGRTWTLSPADLGWALDVDRTTQAAMSVGRDAGLPGNLGAQFGALFGGSQVKPALKYDPALLDKAIARVAADVDKPAVDSKLTQAADGKVSITPSATGSALDRDALRAALVASLQSAPASQTPKPLSFSMREVAPRITESALK